MKGKNMISTTGFRPMQLAPTARPAMAASLTGVSRTRRGPKRSRSPKVGRWGFTWMEVPMPSPARNTPSSISMASASASATACPVLLTGMAQPSLAMGFTYRWSRAASGLG